MLLNAFVLNKGMIHLNPFRLITRARLASRISSLPSLLYNFSSIQIFPDLPPLSNLHVRQIYFSPSSPTAPNLSIPTMASHSDITNTTSIFLIPSKYQTTYPSQRCTKTVLSSTSTPNFCNPMHTSNISMDSYFDGLIVQLMVQELGYPKIGDKEAMKVRRG